MRPISVATLLIVAALPSPATGWFGPPRPTLRQEAAQASAVLYGKLTRATPPNPDEPGGEGVTDFVIEKTLKAHPSLAGTGKLTIKRYLPPETVGGSNLVVFVDVFKGKVDLYRGVVVKAGSAFPAYLEGVLRVKDAKPDKRLRFYFNYLNHTESEIANDALQEYTDSDYKGYRELAARLPGDQLAAWLRDPKTPGHRIGFFALLLGHCSKHKEQDARLLRQILKRNGNAGLDGVLQGLVLLQPKQGWQDVSNLLRDPSEDFRRRYAALRAARFLKEERPDLVSAEEVVKGVTVLVDQPDIADLALHDLRRWRCWDLTDRILTLQSRPGFEEPHISRALLRFALCSPTRAAKRFVEEQRKRDPQLVEDTEELLKIEEGK
jgi:hypothetical protein